MKTKLYVISVLVLLNIIPFVSAAEALDMVYLLVENTFGGILITAVGMIAIFVLVGFWSKMNPLTIMYFSLLFAATFAIGWIGAVAAFPMGIFCIYYVWNSWKNWQNSGGGS